ncbi:MAG: S8 family serine peptidase [Planctomycetes bacterium]|nr:S8 family serine peptidase [Planctomycetota bacterium]
MTKPRTRTLRERINPFLLWVTALSGLFLFWGWTCARYFESVPPDGWDAEAPKGQVVRRTPAPVRPDAATAGDPATAPRPAHTRVGSAAGATLPADEALALDAWNPRSQRALPVPPADPLAAPGAARSFETMPWTERIAWIDRFEYVPYEVLVKFRADAPPSTRDKIVRAGLRARSAADLAGAGADSGVAGWVHVQLPAALPVKQALVLLSEDPAIEYAEPNYLQYTLRTPNDPRFGELWGLHNTGQTGGAPDADVDAPEGWETATGSDVIVADVDTGVDYAHPDLAANMWTNTAELNGAAGVDDDGNGLVDDLHGYDYANNDGNPMDDNNHGSHTSGTIAGVGNNGIGVCGVAWRARIMALKFMTGSGSGSTSAAVQCVNYARAKGARVMSNSWGGGGFSQALKDAVDAANAAGILFVCAAGNSTNDNDTAPFYPANLSSANVITVAATGSGDGIASFSNFGATTVHLGAPGVGILSTVPNNGYSSFSGTSMACPHVAGAAAVLISANPAITLAELKSALLSTTDPVPALAGKCTTGGRLNLSRALGAVRTPGTHLVYASHAVVDNGSAGTSGNGDGVANPGETVRVRVTVTNRGTVAATSGAGTLVSGDARATVTAAADTFGNVASGASVAGAGGFLVALSAALPSNTAVPLTLTTRATNQADELNPFTLPVVTSSTIAGRVTNVVTGAALPGATVAFTGARTGSVLTDASGNYLISPATDGTYSLKASAVGFATSAARSVSVPPNRSGIDLAIAPLAAISGTVSLLSGGVAQPLAGVSVRLSGAASATASTASNGRYTFPALAAGSYTVTPQGSAWSFTPTSRVIALNGVDAAGRDFTAVGLPSAIYTRTETPPLPIPDENATGVSSTLVVGSAGTLTELNVYVRISHTYRGDLRVSLTSPAGTTILLHDQTGGSAPNIDTWYDTLTAPTQSLAAFNGQQVQGTWRLNVADLWGQDVGTLDLWKLEAVTSAAGGPVLAASPLSVAVSAVAGTAPAAVPLSIQNGGSGTLSWSASEGASWLSLTSSSGVNAGTVNLVFNTAGLVAGLYTTSVTLTAAGAANSPLTIPVALTITGSSVTPGLSVSPASLSFTPGPGGAAPAPATVTIANTGGGTLTWSVTSNAAWLTALPVAGVGAGTTTVTANPAGLAPANYTAQLTFSAPGATGSPFTLPVSLTLQDTTPPAAVTDLAAAPVISPSARAPVTAAASSGDCPGYAAVRATDNNPGTSWISRLSTKPTAASITLDLGATLSINRVRLLANPAALESAPRAFSVQVGAVATMLAPVASVSPGAWSANTWVTVDLAPVSTRFLQILVPTTYKSSSIPYYACSLAEVEVYTSPTPRTDALALSWTAPGDNGATGRAAGYDVRYGFTPITEATWSAATQAAGEPLPATAGAHETWMLTGLRPGKVYFLALKTADGIGNVAALSNVTTGMTPGVGDNLPPAAVNNLVLGPAPDGVAGAGSDPYAAGAAASAVAPLDAVVLAATGALSDASGGDAALDGDPETAWTVRTDAPEVDEHLVLDLGAPQAVAGFRLRPLGGAADQLPARFTIEASADAEDWQAIATETSFKGVDGGWWQAGLDAVVARFLRLRALELQRDPTGGFAMSLAEIETLQSAAASSTALTATWTAVGDDGTVGTALAYDLRYATSPINTEAEFAAAQRVAGLTAPRGAGSAESILLHGLSPTTTYYARLKVTDDDGNTSALSNLAACATPAPPDTIPPATISDLAASAATDALGSLPDRILAAWTATGDDVSTGRASSYDLRYSTSPITAATWATATQFVGEPLPGTPGARESVAIAGLAASTTYYLAIKATDEAGNASPLSNVPSATTGATRDPGPPAAVSNLVARALGGVGVRLAPAGATASNVMAGFPATASIDGNPLTAWFTNPYCTSAQHLTLDLGSTVVVAKVRLLPLSSQLSNFPSKFRILAGTDGVTWTTLASPTGVTRSAGTWIEVQFPTVSARFIRMQIDSMSYSRLGQAVVAEFEAHGFSSEGRTAIDLTWSATGDDGMTGRAVRYDLRWSTAPIGEANFAAATPVAGVPAPAMAGAAESFRVNGLTPGTPYYFAIKVIDDAGNASPVSNLAHASTTP